MFHKFTLNFLILSFSQRIANGCDQSLPVVDLTSLDAAENLVEAFQSYGFSYIKGMAIPVVEFSSEGYQIRQVFG